MTSEAPARADPRTLVTILTGFLGSGKTTLMNRALSAPSMARTAVVINEFGAISVDHALTTASNDTILVLENGCLCCTVFGDLLQTLTRLYHMRDAGEVAFDRVLIETSGLAEPAPVIQAFLSDPMLEGLFRIGCLVTTVDAVNGPATLSDHDVAARQVALADTLVVTKLDLVHEPDARRQALLERLRRLNPTAAIAEATDAALDPVALLSQAAPDPAAGLTAARAWRDAALPTAGADGQHGAEHNHDHDHDSGIASFALVREEPVAREALQLLLGSLERHLGPGLLRVKGLVQVAEEPEHPAVIQGAQHLLHNLTWLPRWPDADRRTRIVFITHGIARADLAELVTLLDRVAQRTAAARARASLTKVETG